MVSDFEGRFWAKMANQQALSSSRLHSDGPKAVQRCPDRSVAHLGAVFGDVKFGKIFQRDTQPVGEMR